MDTLGSETVERSHSPSTRYFFRVVTVFVVVVVVVVTVTSTTVVPNPSSLVSVCWWEEEELWLSGFPSYGGREPDPRVWAEAVSVTK
jgi:hypothetical protein